MEIKSIKQINITVLFPEPLNHALISLPDLKEKLKTGEEEKDITSVVEAPGLKVLIFPKREREVIFEQNRLLINVKNPEDLAGSDAFRYLDQGFEQSRQDRGKIAAYGFNFDVILFDSGKGNLVGNRVIKAVEGEVEEQGAKVAFTKNGRKFILQLIPAGSSKELVGNVNIHYSSNVLPGDEILQRNMGEDFGEFKNFIARL